MIRINNLSLELDEAISPEQELDNLRLQLFKRYGISNREIQKLIIFKKAIDARRQTVKFIYNVDVALLDEKKLLKQRPKNVSRTPNLDYQDIPSGETVLTQRPVIIGFGPSGIFAGLLLARRGYKPLILERGQDVDSRTKKWESFQNGSAYDEAGSVLFGEGGAGTFSDGKLTTLINDLRSRYVLNTLVEHGADQDILYINKPHIGTDRLKPIIKSIRNEINDLGGEVRFNAKVTDFIIEDNKLKNIIVNDDYQIKTDVVLLGVGHSARDTFKKLYDSKVPITRKAFSIGIRIEHPQTLIDQAQYGEFANHPALGAADYKLSYHSPSGRSAYSFCMCPGGFVVASISEENTVVTNGMSLQARDNVNANAAILVNVTPDDFGSEHPLAGVEFQRKYEQKAFSICGSSYYAPSQLLKDFLNKQESKAFGSVLPTYKPGVKLMKLDEVLPDFVADTLREAIPYFDTRIKGFALEDAVLTGPETRSSSPIRILRNEHHQSDVLGLYPMGEGAGYAGGIMSSAIDGIKTAEAIISKYRHN